MLTSARLTGHSPMGSRHQRLPATPLPPGMPTGRHKEGGLEYRNTFCRAETRNIVLPIQM